MGNIVNIKPDPLCKLLFDRRLASEYIKVDTVRFCVNNLL